MKDENQKQKILVVEDDEGISEFVFLELQHEGFEVLVSDDGRKALDDFEKFSPDAILLDVMLPSLSGLEVLRRIRKNSSVPVILVTARGETYDKVNGLDAGADDYLSKPFAIEELLARLRAVLRRSSIKNEDSKNENKNSSGIYKAGNLTLNTESMEVRKDGNLIELSKTEYLLLKTLISNKDTVLSRSKIIDLVWGKEHFIDENSVDVYVRYLRNKIGDDFISTVRGSGYVIRSNS